MISDLFSYEWPKDIIYEELENLRDWWVWLLKSYIMKIHVVGRIRHNVKATKFCSKLSTGIQKIRYSDKKISCHGILFVIIIELCFISTFLLVKWFIGISRTMIGKTNLKIWGASLILLQRQIQGCYLEWKEV